MINQHIYRAWDKEDERMIVHEQDFIPLKVTSAGVFRLDPHNEENLWKLIDPDRFEIMPSIGRCDKKGVKIFAGDIVREVFGSHEELSKVRWEPELVGFYPFTIPSLGGHEYEIVKPEDCEVIGDIYQNPELIS